MTEKVRMLGGDKYATFGHFTADRMDPRNANTEEIRDRMIEMRIEAGLSAFPSNPLFPDIEPNFEPDSAPARVAERTTR